MKRFLVKLIVISLTAVMLFVACDIFNPPSNPYFDKILFTSKRSGKNQLYMMNYDGSEITQITSGDYWHKNGRWSQDHSKIVCNTNEGIGISSPFNIAVMNSDGSERALITRGSQMSWHPDGDKILYSYWNFELGIPIRLFCINMIDTSINRIETESSAGMGEFSPDGNKFLYIESDYVNEPPNNKIKIISYPNNGVIYTIDSAGYSPKWSPNGKEIVFSKREVITEPDDIYVMKYNGENIHKVTNNTTDTPFIYPCYSPDGKSILFLAYTVDGTNIWNLYMINTDGTNLRKVVDDSTIVSYDI